MKSYKKCLIVLKEIINSIRFITTQDNLFWVVFGNIDYYSLEIKKQRSIMVFMIKRGVRYDFYNVQ